MQTTKLFASKTDDNSNCDETKNPKLKFIDNLLTYLEQFMDFA